MFPIFRLKKSAFNQCLHRTTTTQWVQVSASPFTLTIHITDFVITPSNCMPDRKNESVMYNLIIFPPCGIFWR